MWVDSYADKYQRINGFKMKLKVSEEEELEGFISLEPSTRSTYDIAMRDATIDGLVTMDKIEELKPGKTFYKTDLPNELFILQSVNKFEFQKKTMRVNAIKQNCFVTVQRMNFETNNYEDVYEDLVSFVTMQNKDEKNFAAGTEDNTLITIQVPKIDYENKIYKILNEDRILLKNLNKELERNVKVESINSFAIPGVIMLSGTFDTRT